MFFKIMAGSVLSARNLDKNMKEKEHRREKNTKICFSVDSDLRADRSLVEMMCTA